MGKFKLNDNVVFLDEDSLYCSLRIQTRQGTEKYNAFFISGGKIVKAPKDRSTLYEVKFNLPNGPQIFDVYEKRLCLKIDSVKRNPRNKKSNHFFTNMFLLPETKKEEKENKVEIKNNINKIPPEERKDDLVKLKYEIKNSENLCREIPVVWSSETIL